MCTSYESVIHVSSALTNFRLSNVQFIECSSKTSGSALEIQASLSIDIFRFTGIECRSPLNAAFCWLALSSTSHEGIALNESIGFGGECYQNTFCFYTPVNVSVSLIHDLNATANSAAGGSGFLADLRSSLTVQFSDFHSNFPGSVLALSSDIPSKANPCLVFLNNTVTSDSALIVASSACAFRDCIFSRNNFDFLVAAAGLPSLIFIRCIFDNKAVDLSVTGDGYVWLELCENRLPEYVSFVEASCLIDRRIVPGVSQAKSDGGLFSSAESIGIGSAVTVLLIVAIIGAVVWFIRSRPSSDAPELEDELEDGQ
jgi:hypothetical protein